MGILKGEYKYILRKDILEDDEQNINNFNRDYLYRKILIPNPKIWCYFPIKSRNTNTSNKNLEKGEPLIANEEFIRGIMRTILTEK